jgi:hypothetical protein
VDVAGAVAIRKRVSRAKMLEFFADLPACLVGMGGLSTGNSGLLIFVGVDAATFAELPELGFRGPTRRLPTRS